MLDLHITHVIANGIKYFSADRTLFDNLFPGVGEALKQRMFTWLTDSKVSFDLAFNKLTTKKTPLITVELTEALYDSQGLGNAGFSTYTSGAAGLSETRYSHEFTSQECRINIFVDNAEGLRVLHQIVKASMLMFTPQLLNSGYQNVLYLGTSSVEPDPSLKSEGGLGIYGRQCIYAALHLLQIPFKPEDITDIGAIPPMLDIQVQKSIYTAADLPSGVAGAVDVE